MKYLREQRVKQMKTKNVLAIISHVAAYIN